MPFLMKARLYQLSLIVKNRISTSIVLSIGKAFNHLYMMTIINKAPMYETNLLNEITSQSLIKLIFNYVPIRLTLKLARSNKLLQRHLSLSKHTYSLYNTLMKRRVIKFNSKDTKAPVKELILSSLMLTSNESLYQVKESKAVSHAESIYSVIQLGHNTVATASKDRKIKIWDISLGKCLKTLIGHTGGVFAVIKLSTEDLVSASFNSEVFVWERDSDYKLKQQTSLSNKSGLIAAVLIRDRLIAMSHWDMSLELFDIEDNMSICVIKEHRQPIIRLALLSTNDLLSFSRDQSLKKWTIKASPTLLQCSLTLPISSADDIHKYVTCFMESPQCSRFALGFSNGTMLITNSALTKSFACAKYHSNPITSIVKLSNSNNCACTAFNEDRLVILDMLTTNSRVIINTREPFEYTLTQLNDNRLLAGVKDGSLKVIGVNSDEFELKLSKGDVFFKKLKAAH